MDEGHNPPEAAANRIQAQKKITGSSISCTISLDKPFRICFRNHVDSCVTLLTVTHNKVDRSEDMATKKKATKKKVKGKDKAQGSKKGK